MCYHPHTHTARVVKLISCNQRRTYLIKRTILKFAEAFLRGFSVVPRPNPLVRETVW